MQRSEVPPGLPDLMQYVEDEEPSVPDELVRYVMRCAGVDVRDDRVLRIVGLAARKFVGGVLHDTYLLRKQRVKHSVKHLKSLGYNPNAPATLATEEVSEVLSDQGVHLRTQMYYVDVTEGNEKEA